MKIIYIDLSAVSKKDLRKESWKMNVNCQYIKGYMKKMLKREASEHYVHTDFNYVHVCRVDVNLGF